MAQPYRQGDLDGLCGVYALVNAVDYLCGPLSKCAARRLFKQILTFLEARAPLASRCSNGIVINDIASILKSVVCKQYPIQRFKPFHRQPGVSKQLYIRTLSEFLQQPNSIVFLALEGYHGHWTLVYRITDKRLLIYDSSEIRYRHSRDDRCSPAYKQTVCSVGMVDIPNPGRQFINKSEMLQPTHETGVNNYCKASIYVAYDLHNRHNLNGEYYAQL